MTTSHELLHDAFRLCNLFRRRYGVYPASIGIDATHIDLLEYHITPSSVREPVSDIPFVLHERATPEKVYLLHPEHGAASSVYLNALRFVPLDMLPTSIQEVIGK